MYQITKACSGCHTCDLVCPVGAPYYDGYHYQIDSEKCISCGTCAEACPVCAIFDPESKKSVVPHEPTSMACDLVVCGGGSGLITAIKAAQAGKTVIVLEKAPRVGGNTNLAHGFFPVYSRLHAEAGVADEREEAVRELSARTEGVISEEIMHTAVYGCSDFVDWLLEFPEVRKHFRLELLGEKRSVGPVFGSAILGFPKRIENTKSKDPSIGPGWMGTLVIRTMLQAIQDEALPVTILTETAAEHLLTDADGAVIGVAARDAGGDLKIFAKNVVLATGGFGGSDEKLDKYFDFFASDRPITRFSVFSNTGDGIDMLEELGIQPDPQRMFVSTFGPAHHPYHYSLYRLLDHPTALSVNLTGNRWFDESIGLMGGAAHIAGSPRQVAWGIFSQENVDEIMHEYLHDPTLSDEHDCYSDYQKDLEEEAAYKKPPVVIADTLEELAKKIGCSSDALVETVNTYNHFCEAGVDKDYGKSAAHLRPRKAGPYYGVYGQLFSECSAGGIMVNSACQVLGRDRLIIPGLYAVGDATSAMHRKGKLAVVSELTWAVASAYTAAVEILKT